MTDTSLVVIGVAFLLPFAFAFGATRKGHGRKAWRLPAGILAVSLAFLVVGLGLGSEIEAAVAAASNIAGLTVPAVLGSVAGILLGGRRT